MKRMLPLFLLVCLTSMAGGSLAGDTGTYRILSYRVALTPRSDGTVAIDYYQKWLVTGGHIPWITVGTANDDFEITSRGGAALAVAPAGQGGWSGARLDLDADYREGRTFEVSFSIAQRRLFYADKDGYRLDFTPGWYDRAAVETLLVSVRFFADPATVVVEPPASRVSGDTMEWVRHGLGAGERFNVHVSIPRAAFPAGIAAGELRGGAGGKSSGSGGLVAFVIVVLVILIIVVVLRSRGGPYSGGRIFYGGMPGGRSSGGRSGGGRSSGGGGGFGGASMSCACACVSCACACACAGGGGAGCARKSEHSCPLCGKERTP